MQPETLALLEDIRESIAYVAEDTAGMTFEAFVRVRRTRQLVAHNIEIIGEAISRLRRRDPEVAAQISDRHRIVNFRNALVHG